MINKFQSIIFGVCLLFSPLLAFGQTTGEPLDGIGDGKPLVIEGSPGGSVYDFITKGLHLLFVGTPVILDGPCASACTLLIDVDRQNVCLTTKAVLMYHKMFYIDANEVKHTAPLNYETPGLNAYIASRGGLPEPDEELMIVPFEQAKQFYKVCKGWDSKS